MDRMDEQAEQHSQEEHSVDDRTSHPQLELSSQPTPMSKAHPSIEELTAMTEAASLSEKDPNDAASFYKENPIDAASLSEKDPSDTASFSKEIPIDTASLSEKDPTNAASFSNQDSTDAASFSKHDRTDATSLSEKGPTDAASLSEKDPTDAASFSQENPIDAASLSEKDPTNTTSFFNKDSTDAALLSEKDPTDAASLSEKDPSPGDAAALAEDQLENKPEPSRTEVELLIQDDLETESEQPSMSEPNLQEDQLMDEAAPEMMLPFQLVEAGPSVLPSKVNSEVSVKDQSLFETPLYEIPKTFDDFEIPMDSSGAIDQVNLPLPEHMLTEAEEEPTAVARSPTLTTINTSPEIKPLNTRLKENNHNQSPKIQLEKP